MSSIQWNLTKERCFDIINITLIEILNERRDRVMPLDKLVVQLNSRTKKYDLHKKYSFSRYLKIEHKGLLNFIESYNFFGVTRMAGKSPGQVFVKIYNELINHDNLNESYRFTKDSEWMIVSGS